MPRHTIIRSQKEIEEIKRIRRQRNTEIQRARRQKLREIRQEKEIETNNFFIKSDYFKQQPDGINDQIKEKRKQRNTELQRLRRANLYIPRRKKIIENEEDYLARRRKRNTEIQRARRQKLKQQKEIQMSKIMEDDDLEKKESEECAEDLNNNIQASTILSLLQACLIQFQASTVDSIQQ
uniref:Uncharacterized protein n=1 Tax=Panagrolaimus sp. ES5 TaxID=591445 RepID=A0AC34FVQ3_9BILA